VILSHAHIDHSGNLPHLVKRGFRGPIYGTHPTCELSKVMLRDSGHIHEQDAEYASKRRFRQGEPPVEPLYTIADAEAVSEYFRPVEYNHLFEPMAGVRAHLVDAGHILGSAAVCLDMEEQRRKHRLWFSGDIGRRDLPILRDPVLPDWTDTLIMECTYGDKPHRDPELAFEELRQVVKRTIERNGKVIIPAFAVGRTQEIVYCLNRMITHGDIPRVPVYVDSPLAVNVTDIFRRFPDYFDAETLDFIQNDSPSRAALGFDLLTYIRSVDESKALNDRRDPMVIISASGMAEAGRILHHLRNNIEDRRNTVLIVSWQAPHTLGRRLAERQEKVKIFGEWYQVNAEVATIGGLSAHGGQAMLVEYAAAVSKSVRQIYLVHGEDKPALALEEKLHDAGLHRVYYPDLHASVEI
jgi:metallo-beta-lactamase family protein